MSLRKRIGLAVARAGLRMASATPNYSSTGRIAALSEWLPSNSSVNAILAADGEQLVRQARDIERRNPWGRNTSDSFVANVIGTGIMPIPRHPDAEVRARMLKAWRRWVLEADADGATDFYGLQSQAARTSFVAGECIARLRRRRVSDGLTVPLQVQLLEPEFLPFSKSEESLANGNVVRWGIEYNQIGRRIAYHLYREHPGEKSMFFQQGVTARVPADEVCHVFHARRPGQQRGETHFAAVMLALYELEKYDRAELVRKAVTAMVAFFERDIDGGQAPLAGQVEQDEQGRPLQPVEPGQYIQLPPGKTIEMSEPKDVGGMYVEFMRVQLRKVAAGCGITYEMLTGDLTGVNYSSIRAGLLEFRRRAEAFQYQVMAFRFCRPVWVAWCEAAALVGVIDAADFATNRADYLDVEWQAPAWAWVDPLKDTQAEVLAIDNLLKPRQVAIKESGYDPEEVDQMIAEDQAREDSLELRRRADNGQPSVEPVDNSQAADNGQQANTGADNGA